MGKIWKERFWSEGSARAAARRVEAKTCCRTTVEFVVFADGRRDWLLTVFAD